MTAAPPPRPPALDPARAEAARGRLAAAVRKAADQLAAGKDEPDIWVYAGVRLLAGMLGDLPGAYARRDLATVERVAREVEGLAGRLPKHLADCRTPGAWAERGPIELDLGLPKRRRWPGKGKR